jgi:hypothetical protein
VLIHLQNLGLGVLEADPEENASGSNGDKADDDGGDRPQDVLGKLMGRERAGAGVQVVEEQREAK